MLPLAWLLVSCMGPRIPTDSADDTAVEPSDSGDTDDSGAPDDTGPGDIADLDPSTLPAGDAPCRAPSLTWVVDVIDGDTVEVQPVGGGGRYRVRLIGFDAPEIAHGDWGEDECWGPEAHDAARDLLTNERVWLTFDATCTDPYDRTLAYLHLGADAFVNEDLVRAGHGRIMTISPNDSLVDRLRAAETEAKLDGAGMWGACI